MGLQIPRDISVDFSNCRYIILNAKQYDSRSRFIRITCTNLGQKFHLTPDNYSAFIRYRKPDGYSVFNKCIISTDGKIIFELTEQMLSTVGTSYADLVIIDIVKSDINNDTTIISADGKIIENNNSLVSTMNFYINVLERPLDDEDIISTNEFSALNELLNKANKDYEYIVTTTREYMDNAHQSETNAKQSEDNARQSEINSKESEDNAKQSEINAKDSENISLEKAAEAEASQSAAKESENKARQSEINAKQSEDNAKQSEINSADNANLSQSYAVGGTGIRDGEDTDNSKYYKEQAAISETNADISAATATTKANEAATSANTAENAANTATDKATSASESAKDAKTAADTSIDKADIATNAAATATTKANEAATSAETSLRNATDASNSATSAQENATKAESFLHGGSGIRENEDTDNSKYYYEQTKDIADNANIIISYKTEYQQSISGTDIPTGEWSTDIPEIKQGTYLWTRITLIFTNGQTSVNYSVAYSGIDGSGGSASNLEQVVCDSDGNVILDSNENKLSAWGQRYVVGLKGDTERDYRDGNVNITAENVGALPLDGIAKNMDDMLDTHGITPNQQTFPADRGLPFAGTPGETIDDDIANWIKTVRSGFYTVFLNKNKAWYNVLNLRHRNGYGDGSDFGMYFYARMQGIATANIDLVWRQQTGGSWGAEKILLDNNNYSKQILLIDNRLKLTHGSYVSEQVGTAGTSGLVNFMRIKIKQTYANYPLVFLLSGRGRSIPAIVSVYFYSADNTDPGLFKFQKMFDATYNIYIYKTGTSQWDLYADKSEGYGRIDILDLWYSKEHFDITFPNTNVASANSAWTAAVTAGIVNMSKCVRDKTNGTPIYLGYAGPSLIPNDTRPYLALWNVNGDNTYDLKATHINNFIQAKMANSYYGMCAGAYADNVWIRTTSQGLLPYQSGNYNYGHSSLGTDSWRFATAYIDRIYTGNIYSPTGNLNGYPNQVYLNLSPGIMKLQNVHGSYIGFESNAIAGLYIYPGSTGTGTIGTSSLKWNQFYATNSTISTSDVREKKEISYIGENSNYDTYMSDETLKSFIRGLLSVVYKRVNGESGRPHHGFIAQDIEELMQKLGIKDHAGFIKSPKTETVEVEEEVEETYTDEADGRTKTRTIIQKREEEREIPGEYIYGLRYEEFIADIVRFIQLQDNKIKEQEEKINKQQEELNDLKARFERLEALIA